MKEFSVKELENTASSYHDLMVPALFEKYADQIIDEAKIERGDKSLILLTEPGL